MESERTRILLWLMLVFVASVFGNTKVAKNGTQEDDKLANEDLNLLCRSSAQVSAAHRNDCCAFTIREFRYKWFNGGYYLTEYLSKLRDWECQEFKKECEKPVYAFTEFTHLVYDAFCDRNALLAKCTEDLHGIARKYDFSAEDAAYGSNDALHITNRLWTNLTSSLRPKAMTLEDLKEPCVAIALFDRPTGGVGRFHEVVQPFTIFCYITWTGYDIDTAIDYQVSPWTSWPLRCRASIIICMVIAGVLGAAIVIANTVVISVYVTTPKLQNSQAVFKTSIAIADFTAGLLVLPNVIVFQYLNFISPHTMGDVIADDSADLVRRLPGGTFDSIVPKSYISFVGFFTTMSVFISVYSLLCAGFDRFWAIFRPLKYNKTKAKRYAKICSIITWVVAVLWASIPFTSQSLRYALVLSILVTSSGFIAMILLAIAFGIPLITLNAINIGTFRSAQKHARVRQRLKCSTGTAKQEESMERRLSKILGLMGGIFSLCFFPIFFSNIMGAMFDNIVFINPSKLDPNAAVIFHSAQYCTCFLFLSNSLWNCFIYSSRGEEFRKSAKTLRAVKVSGTIVSYIGSSLRRLSEAPGFYYRRKSSSASSFGTDVRTNSSISTRLPSVDSSSVFGHESNSSTNLQTYHGRKSSDSVAPKVYYSAVIKDKKSKDNGQYATEDSTFGSFAIDAGADRLFVSVMENIEEDEK